MGGAKRYLEEMMDRGYYSVPEKNVCKNHFSDYALIDFIEDNSFDGVCDYCGEKVKVVSMDNFIEFINDGINQFYSDPDQECLPYDSEEGGYYGTETFDSSDLFNKALVFDTDLVEVLDDIIGVYSDRMWCERNPLSLPEHEELSYDWAKFCSLVKYKIRFSFFKVNLLEDERGKDMEYILREIANAAASLSLERIMHKSEKLYRCRQHCEDEKIEKIKSIASPPAKWAVNPNRMSPVGISMFYAAFDPITAITEIIDYTDVKDKPSLTIGTFKSRSQLRLIDFTLLPKVPSIFDRNNRENYYKILFFQSFIDDLSKDLKSDGNGNVDYIPTQIMTEYFRYIYPIFSGSEIDGIIYPSSKNIGGNCCVLFKDHDRSKKDLKLTKIISKRIVKSPSELVDLKTEM